MTTLLKPAKSDENLFPLLPQDPLQTALSAYRALNAELKAEFLREIVADNQGNSPDADITSSAGVLKDDPYWDEFKAILKTYREPVEED